MKRREFISMLGAAGDVAARGARAAARDVTVCFGRVG
jgi:hypothetical protein